MKIKRKKQMNKTK